MGLVLDASVQRSFFEHCLNRGCEFKKPTCVDSGVDYSAGVEKFEKDLTLNNEGNAVKSVVYKTDKNLKTN